MRLNESLPVQHSILRALYDVYVGGLSRHDLSKACGYWKKEFSYALESLVQSGDVTYATGPSPLGTCIYCLTDKGRKRIRTTDRASA